MYRIALQMTPATPTKPATFQYLTGAGSTPWEAEAKADGLKKYEEELDNYKKSVISLVKIVDIELECRDANPSCEYDKDGDGIHDNLQPGTEEPKDPENPGTEGTETPGTDTPGTGDNTGDNTDSTE